MMWKRLRSTAGFSYMEMLSAVAILAILMGAMGTGITSMMRVYRTSVQYSEAQVLASTVSTAVSDQLRWAQNPVDRGDTVTFTGGYGQDQSLALMDGKLTLGGQQLLGSGVYSSGLALQNLTVDYGGGAFQVAFEVVQGGTVQAAVSFATECLGVSR